VWGVLPEKLSTFLIHPTNASPDEKRSWQEARRADVVLQTGMESWRRSGFLSERDLPGAVWDALLGALTSNLDAKLAFDQNRRGPVPWVVNPRAWQNRLGRKRSARRLNDLKRRALMQGSVKDLGNP